MSLPDSAEYWWDVKTHFNDKKIFSHIKGFDCGHYHVWETTKLVEVTCYACLEYIENTPELKNRLEQSKKSIEEYKFRFGKCDCGEPMCERINKKTNEKFLGCSNYPKCTKTRKL